jgi:hypothetical protein
VENARLRLRGVYGIIAAALLLLVTPIYQAFALTETYTRAVLAIGQSRDFSLYVAWLVANLGTDQTLRVLQALPLALAFLLPGPLAAWLWPDSPRSRWAATIAGWSGFGIFVIAAVVGFITSANTAASYATATTAAARDAIATAFGREYALQSLLSRGIGGIALAIFLAMIGLRLALATRFPRWVAYLTGLVAAVEAANAVVFILNPLNVLALTATLAPFALAIWLLVIGVALLQGTGRSANSAGATRAEGAISQQPDRLE